MCTVLLFRLRNRTRLLARSFTNTRPGPWPPDLGSGCTGWVHGRPVSSRQGEPRGTVQPAQTPRPRPTQQPGCRARGDSVRLGPEGAECPRPRAGSRAPGGAAQSTWCGELDRGPHTTPLLGVLATLDAPGVETTRLSRGRRRPETLVGPLLHGQDQSPAAPVLTRARPHLVRWRPAGARAGQHQEL